MNAIEMAMAQAAVEDDNEGPLRRVREEVRDGVYVMVFSCAASTVTAIAVLVVTRLAG